MQIILHKSADARVRARTNVDNKRNPHWKCVLHLQWGLNVILSMPQ